MAKHVLDPLYTPPRSTKPGDLHYSEVFWRDQQKWLESRGYRLRPRFAPDWTPSWNGTSKRWDACEDGQQHTIEMRHVMDAVRISDGSFVALKSISKTSHPHEADIAAFFSSTDLASDPLNHCVALFETLEVPDNADRMILVMPFLRKYNNPWFEAVSEVVDFLQQIFDGLKFMHDHHIAHRGCVGRNIMMDPTPLYPNGYHPVVIRKARNFKGNAKHVSRTKRPTKYYFIDFGLSRRHKPEELPPSEPIITGVNKSAPEHQVPEQSCNPFSADVYCLGNMIRINLLDRCSNLAFLAPLVKDMMQVDPAKRPTMDEVVSRFDALHKSLSKWKLRSRAGYRIITISFMEAFRQGYPRSTVSPVIPSSSPA